MLEVIKRNIKPYFYGFLIGAGATLVGHSIVWWFRFLLGE